MSIDAIAKSLAKEIMNTREYHTMNKLKHSLYNSSKLGESIRDYESRQFEILNKKVSSAKKQAMLSNLNGEYRTLLSTDDMQKYTASINAFQRKNTTVFEQLNREIVKIINRM